MVSVVYEHRGSGGEPVTFSMLCSDETVQRKWEEYRAATPSGIPKCIWKKRVDMAEEWLRHPSLANDVVKIVAEVQCVLSEYRDVRLRMHETYKVFRAVDGASLHLDYVQTVEKQKGKSKQGKKKQPESLNEDERAVRCDDAEKLEILLRGAEKGPRELSSLFLAAIEESSMSCAELLLQKKVDVALAGTGSRQGALHLAGSCGNLATVEWLLGKGSIADAQDDEGKTATSTWHLAYS